MLDRAYKWFERATKEKDPIVKFVLLYITLEVITKSAGLTGIRALNRSVKFENHFSDFVEKKVLLNLKQTLDRQPLENMNPHGDARWNGKLCSWNDFKGCLEFVIRARNNLFHGDKSLDNERDLYIISRSNILLNSFISAIKNYDL